MMETTMQNVSMMEGIAVVIKTVIPIALFVNAWNQCKVDALMLNLKVMDIVMTITTMPYVNMMEEIVEVITLI